MSTQFPISDGLHSVRTSAQDGLIGGMVFGKKTTDQYGTSIGKYIPKGDENYEVGN